MSRAIGAAAYSGSCTTPSITLSSCSYSIATNSCETSATCSAPPTTAQALEVFFGSVLYVILLYRPFVRHRDLALFNRLSSGLYRTMRKRSFVAMRNLFLWTIINRIAPSDLAETEAVIGSFPRSIRMKKGELARAPEGLRGDLEALWEARAPVLRNRVVHKDAYRPSLKEAKEALEEAKAIIYALKNKLGPVHSFEHYANSRAGGLLTAPRKLPPIDM
jgi:hypothetical protein